jgi:hypothetical protein
MASKNHKSNNIQVFVKEHLEEAQKRVVAFEAEAERGKEQRKELEGLVKRVNGEAGTEVRKRLDGLQQRVVEATGFATQSQVRQISRELAKLSKKLDALKT